MLEKQDLQAIKELIDASVTASEERMKDYVIASEERMKDYVTASEERMKDHVAAAEERMKDHVTAAENRWMAFYEGSIQPQIQLLAEGHQTLLETLAPKNRVEALEDEVVFMKSVIKALAQDVAELKKAQ